MRRPATRLARWIAVSALALTAAAPAPARTSLFGAERVGKLDRVNASIAGRVIDFTHNHGCDRRLYSPALGQRRDLYVYLPPGYDGRTLFPGAVWLHGIGYDEQNFLEVIQVLDREIRSGAMPPMVIAAPDGSIRGHPSLFMNGSFYVNSAAGRFEDYVVQDVWGFVRTHFAVRPERDAHVLAGVSMGGFGAFNLAFKHPGEFGQIAGVMPPLNLRYGDCHGRYFANYDPNCVMLRPRLPRKEVVGRFYGVITIRSRQLLSPLLDRLHADPVPFVAAENPIEMLFTYDVRPGEFGMFIGYGTKDEFNIDAQVQHFLDVAATRGIRPDVLVVVQGGHHNRATAEAMVPMLSKWATDRLARFVPPGYSPACGVGPARPLCAVPRPGVFPAGPGGLSPPP